MRIALGIEYDGSNFRGWQIQQAGVPTVQGCLEKALSQVAAQCVNTVCAGRTDAGVHGIEQVVHFDTDAQRPLRAWLLGVNSNLPGDISLRWAQPVAETFHARFSALSRCYRYIILNRPYRSALQRKRATWQRGPLNHEPMAEAATHLLGEHDFTSFRATACQANSPIRTIYNLTVERQGDYLAIDIEANGFLHHMVRNVAGVLLAIGRGEQLTGWPRDLLKVRNRALAGVTAPAEGLYLKGIRYPAEFGLPDHATNSSFHLF
jgi:tRNA pseudouridine38-40 synthase